MEIVNNIIENFDQIVSVLGSIVVLCSLIVVGTKTPNPDTKLGKVYKIVEFLALMVGKSKKIGKK